MSERLSRGRCGPYPPVTHRNCLTTTEQGSDPEAIEKAGKKLGKGLFLAHKGKPGGAMEKDWVVRCTDG